MAKNNTTAKAIETADIEAVKETAEAVKAKAPVVPAGEYYKNVKVRFLGLICAPYGTFDAGDTGEIPLADAKALAGIGKCEIIEE